MAQPRNKKKKQPMNPVAKAQRLDVVIGILGFFTFAAFVSAAYAEIRGEDALTEALILLLFVLGLGWAIKTRRDMRL